MGKGMSHDGDLILLAEDDENDIALFQRAFRQAKISNPVHIVRDGEEAIAYLKGEGKFSDHSKYPLPTLFLLDLKMPRKNGFEVLQWLRQQPELKALRVVVLTTSTDWKDVNLAYELGANSFLVKSMDIQDFAELAAQVKHCWLAQSLAAKLKRPKKDKPSGARGVTNPSFPCSK